MPHQELQGFGAAARRAIARAEDEAGGSGHQHLGTEHLLLGLLADPASGASRTLTTAGVTLAAARHKVNEAVGPPEPGLAAISGPLPTTPRAARALGRAVRFSHQAHSDLVASEHLLLGVLDVEGRAGQVLRGLGVDVEGMRRRLGELDVLAPEGEDIPIVDAGPGTAVAAACRSCGVSLEDALIYRVVSASGERRSSRDAVVFSCGACGVVVGVSQA